MNYSLFLCQSPVDKTLAWGEGGINKAPFGSYKGFFMIKPNKIKCVGQWECCCFAVVSWCISVAPWAQVENQKAQSRLQVGQCLVGDCREAAVLWCLHARFSPWSFDPLSAVKLTFWKVVSKEPPAHVWWVTRGFRGLPLCWQCWGSWVGWGSGTGQCCWHCWCWHWSLKMSSCWEWRWSPPTSHEMETRYRLGCCQTYWCAKVAGWWMSGGTHSCHHFGNSWHGFQTSLQLSVKRT